MIRLLKRTWSMAALAVFFVYELVLSSVRVAWAVIAPNPPISPGIIAVPLDVRTDLQITLFANLVSLTPGTLSLDVSEDRRTLYVHDMFVDDPATSSTALKAGMERKVLEATS